MQGTFRPTCKKRNYPGALVWLLPPVSRPEAVPVGWPGGGIAGGALLWPA